MSKTESSFTNMLVTLFVVSLLSSASVGIVYELTRGPIAEAAEAKKVDAIRAVVPEFDNNPVAEEYTLSYNEEKLKAYPATRNGIRVGTAVEASTSLGFGGTILLMIGLLPDGTISDISVLEHKETPGLGDKIEPGKSGFIKQFTGQHPSRFTLKVKKDGGSVDAITAATISSRAFCDGVARAVAAYAQEKQP